MNNYLMALVLVVALAAIWAVPFHARVIPLEPRGQLVASKDYRALARMVATFKHQPEKGEIGTESPFEPKNVEWVQTDYENQSITLRDDFLTVTISCQSSADRNWIDLKRITVILHPDERAQADDEGSLDCSSECAVYGYPKDKHPMLHLPARYTHSFICQSSEAKVIGWLRISNLEFEIDGDKNAIREGRFASEPYNLN